MHGYGGNNTVSGGVNNDKIFTDGEGLLGGAGDYICTTGEILAVLESFTHTNFVQLDILIVWINYSVLKQ